MRWGLPRKPLTSRYILKTTVKPIATPRLKDPHAPPAHHGGVVFKVSIHPPSVQSRPDPPPPAPHVDITIANTQDVSATVVRVDDQAFDFATKIGGLVFPTPPAAPDLLSSNSKFELYATLCGWISTWTVTASSMISSILLGPLCKARRPFDNEAPIPAAIKHSRIYNADLTHGGDQKTRLEQEFITS
jgi:hypothetical protein